MRASAALLGAIVVIGIALATIDAGAGSWPRRHGNLQNTGDVGDDPTLTPENAKDLRVVSTIPLPRLVNATPVISDGLIFIGDSTNRFNVIDVATEKKLVTLIAGNLLPETGTFYSYSGIQSTAQFAAVTVPDGDGGTKEEKRVYIGAYSATTTLWCLNVDAILADREALLAETSDGEGYLCPGFPIPLAGPGSNNPTYHGSVLYSQDQPINVNGSLEVRDVIYAPSTGIDCANGVLWAVDASSGDKLGMWDPVVNGNGTGGVIWFSPAMSKDKKHLYVTTGDCVTKPQVGELAESIVALDPTNISGPPLWYHRRRLMDAADVDVGNGPTVVDVQGADGCHRIVSVDKDGCFYGFEQEADIPEVGELGFDPFRIGEQRLLWRTCFVAGGIEGGFNALAATFHGRYAFAQASGGGRYDVTINVGTDDARGFLVDACTGDFQWASSVVGWGMGEAAIASGMIFQPAGRDTDDPIPTESHLQVIRAAGTYELLATVELPAPATYGGGGPSIVDGRIYVPLRDGIAIVAVDPGSNVSPPQDKPTSFAGPYPAPLWWTTDVVVDPENPY